MHCSRLLAECNDCKRPVQPVSFWLTDTKALLVTSICPNCERKINTLWYMTDLYKNCPKPDPAKLSKAIADKIAEICKDPNKRLVEPFTEEDLKFLHELGSGEIL